jgi:hypothetical protein
MSEKSLEKFYYDLIPKLWNELLFYIPNKGIPKKFIDKFENLQTQKIFNKIMVMDYHYGPITYKKGRDNKSALLKGSSLEKNIYKLLKKKSDTELYEFNYVLEEYFEQVECLFYITDWMNNNLNHILLVDDTVKGLFQIQFIYYKKHFKTLIKHFYPTKNEIPLGNFNDIEIIEKYFPDIIERYKKAGKTITNSSITLVEQEQNVGTQLKIINEDAIASKQLLKKEKKPQLITEKEAEAILLERVFNVDLKI